MAATKKGSKQGHGNTNDPGPGIVCRDAKVGGFVTEYTIGSREPSRFMVSDVAGKGYRLKGTEKTKTSVARRAAKKKAKKSK